MTGQYNKAQTNILTFICTGCLIEMPCTMEILTSQFKRNAEYYDNVIPHGLRLDGVWQIHYNELAILEN